MQLNFLQLTSASAIQRILITFSSHHIHQHNLHSSHSKWKDLERWPLEFISTGGEKLSSGELLKDHLVQSSCKLDTISPSSHWEECSFQFEFSSERLPSLHDQLPIMDLAVPREGCQQYPAACRIELNPVCFHNGHQYFSAGG